MTSANTGNVNAGGTAAAGANPNRALWEKGDFTRIASFMRESGEAVAKSVGVKPPARVLDLGCGDGTTALPMARLGVDVIGVDIASNLVAAGNQRAKEAGLDRLKFQQGDACDLAGIDDASFDVTISIFGAMFAPRPFDVAKQMVRVTKPGGRIVMGNWIPGDPTFVSQVLRISSAFVPPPPGFISPMTWGVEKDIVERFSEAGIAKDRIAMTKETFWFKSPSVSPAEFIGVFRDYYGPTMNAFDAARANGKVDDLQRQLVELAMAQNQDRAGGTAIPATFLRIDVQR